MTNHGDGYADRMSIAAKQLQQSANFMQAMHLDGTERLDKINHHIAEAGRSQTAAGFQERLLEMIRDFEADLDPEQEVGARLVNFGQTLQFHLLDIGYYNPHLIRFYGQLDNGTPVELIQHTSQISVMLVAMKKADPSKPARRIGLQSEMEDRRADGTLDA